MSLLPSFLPHPLPALSSILIKYRVGIVYKFKAPLTAQQNCVETQLFSCRFVEAHSGELFGFQSQLYFLKAYRRKISKLDE